MLLTGSLLKNVATQIAAELTCCQFEVIWIKTDDEMGPQILRGIKSI